MRLVMFRPINTVCTAIVLLLPALEAAGDETERPLTGKKVISFGWDMPNAVHFANYAQRLQGSGFDGVVLNFTKRSTATGADTEERKDMRYYWVHWEPVQLDEIEHNVDAVRMANPGRLKHNFLSIYPSCNAGNVSPAQFFVWDSQKYDTTKFKPFRPGKAGEPQSWPEDPYQYLNAFKHNMVLAARLCRDSGFVGFCIDQETYGRGPMNDVWPMEVFDEPIETIRDRVRRNVAEVFRAVCDEYPEIQILLIPGGRYTSTWDKNDSLAMAFTDGILMGLGPKATIHDGQEKAYDLSLHKRFVALNRETREAGIRFSAVPDLYRERMRYSFGLWLDFRSGSYGGWHDDPYLNHFSATDFGNALHHALHESDGYVWVYNEQAIFWPARWREDKKPNIASAYLEAIRNCKTPRPLDRQSHSRGAENEPQPQAAASYATTGDRFETAAPDLKLVTSIEEGWEIALDPEDIGLWSLGIRTPGGEEKFNWRPIRVAEFWENQGYVYNGAAFYRVRFKVPEKYRGRKIYIVMGGVANKCHVHLNTWEWIYGVYKGAGMSVPAKDPLRFPARGVKFGDEEENLLRVYVRNPRGPGGIYKPVWIAVEKDEQK